MQAAWLTQACLRAGGAVYSSPDTVVDASLHRLCEQLVTQHFTVELSVESLCGERDVRLRVCRHDHPAVSVEVLAPDPSTWMSRCWDAVRIDCGRRRLWRGPDQERPLEEVVDFVSGLLCLTAAQLAQRYVDVG